MFCEPNDACLYGQTTFQFDAVSPVVTGLRVVVILAFAVVGAVLGFLVYDATSSSDINAVRRASKGGC